MHVAYRQACLNAIEYLKKFGYTGAQAYSLLGCAPVQGHISRWWTCAPAPIWLPTDIFDFDLKRCRRPQHSVAGSTDVLAKDK